MTELQPTEIELTSKRRPSSRGTHSKRKIIVFISAIILILFISVLTVILAHQVSKTPQLIQPQTVSAEGTTAQPQEQSAAK